MSAPPAADAPNPETEALSPAELKKRAKAEKQARRAAQKEQQQPSSGGADAPESSTANGESRASKPVAGPSRGKSDKAQQQKGKSRQGDQGAQDARMPNGPQQVTLPSRRRPSQAGGQPRPQSKKDNKRVELFSHLYTQPRRHSVEGVSKDIHPAVLALGFQISSYEICGSTARCTAMLLAFKEAIQDYTTPGGTSLARHLTPYHLSPQIDYLKSCRPISESMGNAIRWLKKLVVEIDPSTAEQEAKDYLCENIDKFIQERITVTDQAIADSASSQIRNGSVVLTYAKSSIVEKTLLQAHANGTKFRVVIVDSRPLFEGKNLATSLMHAGLQVEYLPFSGIARAISSTTLVLLGAHSMLSNGRLQSRVGTASIALAAHKADVPVIVLCESVKFSGKVALDSLNSNEIAPPEELLLPPSNPLPPISTTSDSDPNTSNDNANSTKTLHDWINIPNLQILNLMYDVTPAEYIRMVICEYGNVPPSSVPVVHRLANEGL